MSEDNILEIKNLTKTYPGVVALNNVNIGIRRGEVHAIIGENGAGKSTLIKTITGAEAPDNGIIRFDNNSYCHLTPTLSSGIGIGVIYQEFTLVPWLTVAENVFLGHYLGSKGMVDFKAMSQKTREAMARIGVDIPPLKRVIQLTVAHQQCVEIARGLVRDLKLLILDEPSAALMTHEVERMLSMVTKLKEQGVTIVYVSHRLEEIFKIADRVSVMCDGQCTATLDVGKTSIPELIKLMVRRELVEEWPERTKPVGAEHLRVENLCGNGVSDISFTLHKGEILGFAGLMGCGRTETMEVLFGAKKKDSGKVFIDGREVNIRNTEQALKYSIGLIPEDRKKHGLFLPMSVKWNTSISCLKKKLLKRVVVDKKKEHALALDYVRQLRTKTPGVEQAVDYLSGGNQQKVVIARVLATDADIMIFDEPTRGIDVGAKQEIYQMLRQLADEGKAIIIISSELGEVIGLSDRMVVLCEGKQMGTLMRQDFSQERILTLASGIQ